MIFEFTEMAAHPTLRAQSSAALSSAFPIPRERSFSLTTKPLIQQRDPARQNGKRKRPSTPQLHVLYIGIPAAERGLPSRFRQWLGLDGLQKLSARSRMP